MFKKEFSELILIVQDIPAAARFYQDVVGLQPQREATEDWAWFWIGEPEKNQRIALHKGPLLFEEHSPRPEGKCWGQVHYAFRLPWAQLEEAAAHVRDQGIEVYGPRYFDSMNAKSYRFYDLDGNLLEFSAPAPGQENGTKGGEK